MKRRDLQRFAALGIDLQLADQVLISLLHIRDAWSLGTLPGAPRLAHSPLRSPPPPSDLGEILDQWNQQWQHRLDDLATGGFSPPSAATESPALVRSWLAEHPAAWLDTYAELGFDRARLGAWTAELLRTHIALKPTRFPELHLLDACTTAREHGLRQLVLLPLAGAWYYWHSPTVLCLSTECRKNIALYSEALQSQMMR